MVVLKDISLFFKSSCCVSGPTERSVVPCRTAAKLDPYDWMRVVHSRGCELRATTITIGNVYYGRMSDSEQYESFKKHIKRHVPLWQKDIKKYIYVFEYQKNGQLHAHGLEYNLTQSEFEESFSRFGRRNSHRDAYQVCRNIQKYIVYMQKEQHEPIFPMLTNITQKDIHSILKEQPPQGLLSIQGESIILDSEERSDVAS